MHAHSYGSRDKQNIATPAFRNIKQPAMMHVLKLSGPHNSMEYSLADSRVKVWNSSNTSGMESVPTALENFHTLTRLSAREDFVGPAVILTVHFDSSTVYILCPSSV